jgi:hypothetical protein
MPTYYTEEDELHVTPYEFVMDCNPREINELVRALVTAGLLTQDTAELYTKKCSAPEQIFEKHLSRIHGKLLQLTAEEEEAIIHIANRVGD